MISVEDLNELPYPEKIYAIGLSIIGPFTASHKHHLLKCNSCGHEWSATPLAKINAYKKYKNPGCPACTYEKRYGKGFEQNKIDIENRGFEILSDTKIKHQTVDKIVVRNKKCGHTFETYPGNILHRDIECPVCARDYLNNLNRDRNKQNHLKWLETASEWEIYESECRILTNSVYKQYEQIINPNNYFVGATGITGAHHIDHIIPVRTGFEKNIPKELICHYSNLQVIPWEVNIRKSSNINFIPKIFSEWFDTSGISEFEDVLFDLGFAHDVFTPYPLCYIKDKISITYCKFEYYLETTTQRKQLNKTVKNWYIDKGIRNIQIYEDEFKNNPLLCIQKIKHLINQNKSTVIHARKCDIRQLQDVSYKNRFLQCFHIQGSDASQIIYGAFYQNELIAVMTFSQPRVFYGKAKYKANTWELSRFATNTNFKITGIANRLLKKFKQDNTWSQVISYADRRWSDGDLYFKLNFKLNHINPPGYYYIIDGTRKHRWNYRKDVLKTWDNYADNKTEFQITSEKGIGRVWDCGTMLFILENK